MKSPLVIRALALFLLAAGAIGLNPHQAHAQGTYVPDAWGMNYDWNPTYGLPTYRYIMQYGTWDSRVFRNVNIVPGPYGASGYGYGRPGYGAFGGPYGYGGGFDCCPAWGGCGPTYGHAVFGSPYSGIAPYPTVIPLHDGALRESSPQEPDDFVTVEGRRVPVVRLRPH
jgi:hypothetical protein